MRIVHLSLSDRRGGAARAAYRLHHSLRAGGLDSRMFVRIKLSTEPEVEPFEPRKDFWSRLKRVSRRIAIVRRLSKYQKSRPPGPFTFHAQSSELGGDLTPHLPQADVLNLHWVSTFVDFRAFFDAVGGRVPVVWTLHDMNPFTGGCHYSGDCDGYLRQCGRCPQLGSSSRRDLSHSTWRQKRKALDRVPAEMFHVVTPSRWLQKEARRSSLFGRFGVHAIPNCLDTGRIEPRHRQVAREALDVPLDASVVLFVAGNPEMPRKGFRFLVEALLGLTDLDGLLLLTLGQGKPAVPDSLSHRHIGALSDERLLSLVYSAADVFAAPSLEDNLPNTVLESMACGTPPVGFGVGGIPDMIRPGETGLLAPPGDVAGLREAIRSLLADPAERERIGRTCRQTAVREYAQAAGARRYAKLYERICSPGGVAAASPSGEPVQENGR